jgi:hypothetical protein
MVDVGGRQLAECFELVTAMTNQRAQRIGGNGQLLFAEPHLELVGVIGNLPELAEFKNAVAVCVELLDNSFYFWVGSGDIRSFDVLKGLSQALTR